MWAEYVEIHDELKLVEKYVKSNIHSRNKLLSEIVNELVDAGGKRLRPAFVIVASKFGRYNRKKVISMAGAIEILHTATLVHDDVIDNAEFRRGKLTVAEKYGKDMAIYTGDFLFTKAVLMLSSGMPVERLEMVTRSIKVICEGEVDQYQDKYNINTSVMSYLKRISRKTAVLFSTACAAGAYLSKCPEKDAKSLFRFGFCYGMAFQIRDDLKDFLSEKSIEGKPVANDLARGIVTLPVIYTINGSSDARKQVEEYVLKNEQNNGSDFEKILEIIKKQGGIDYSRRILNGYIRRGLKALESLPDNKYRSIFENLIRSLEI